MGDLWDICRIESAWCPEFENTQKKKKSNLLLQSSSDLTTSDIHDAYESKDLFLFTGFFT